MDGCGPFTLSRRRLGAGLATCGDTWTSLPVTGAEAITATGLASMALRQGRTHSVPGPKEGSSCPISRAKRRHDHIPLGALSRGKREDGKSREGRGEEERAGGGGQGMGRKGERREWGGMGRRARGKEEGREEGGEGERKGARERKSEGGREGGSERERERGERRGDEMR